MSYELFVYSQQKGVASRGALRRAMLAQGWEVRILPNRAFRSKEPIQLLPDDAALDFSLLAGWPVQQENSKLLDAMFAAGNMVGLSKLFEDELAFETCGVSVTCPFVYNSEDLECESEWQLRQAVGYEVVSFRKKSHVTYDLNQSGMGAVTAEQFIDALWKCIGRLSDGLLDDSQKGDFYFVTPRHRLVRVNGISRRLTFWLRRLFAK